MWWWCGRKHHVELLTVPQSPDFPCSTFLSKGLEFKELFATQWLCFLLTLTTVSLKGREAAARAAVVAIVCVTIAPLLYSYPDDSTQDGEQDLEPLFSKIAVISFHCQEKSRNCMSEGTNGPASSSCQSPAFVWHRHQTGFRIRLQFSNRIILLFVVWFRD